MEGERIKGMHISIRYITRAELDTAAYDACISKADNGCIYAYSTYIDTLSEQWDVLVAGNYETVMPLPWRKKHGFRYLFMPQYIPVLGVFGGQTGERTDAFLKAIPPSFKFWDIYLNRAMQIPSEYHPYQRTNFVLDLNGSYEEIRSRYRENIRRNCKKSEQMANTVHKGIPVEEVLRLARSQMQTIANIPEESFRRFQKLFDILEKEKKAVTYGVHAANGQLLASCVFFFSHNRAYYILVGNHPNGRTLGASHALIDGFIRDHAGSPMKLDFEGSDIRNLAFFYSSFGASEEIYFGIRRNNLPWYAKLFKK